MFKKLLVGVLVVLAMGMGSVFALNPNSFEISCAVVTNYSVAISTPETGLEFGSKALNTPFVHSTSATITNNGTVKADWKLKAYSVNTWTLGTTIADNGSDKAVLAAKFNILPTGTGDYTDNDVLLTASEKSADATNFAGTQNGDNVAKDAEKLLWIYIKTPNDTTVDTAQRFRVEVTAYPSSTF